MLAQARAGSGPLGGQYEPLKVSLKEALGIRLDYVFEHGNDKTARDEMRPELVKILRTVVADSDLWESVDIDYANRLMDGQSDPGLVAEILVWVIQKVRTGGIRKTSGRPYRESMDKLFGIVRPSRCVTATVTDDVTDDMDPDTWDNYVASHEDQGGQS